MELNLFDNFKKEISVSIKNFMEELSSFLNNTQFAQYTQDNSNDISRKNSTYPIDGHLYLVTEDRNNEVYLWDFTDKPETEFVEKDLPSHILNIAKEGSMLQYKNGAYELYSENGYDMLFNEK